MTFKTLLTATAFTAVTATGMSAFAQATPARDGTKAVTKDMPEEITDADKGQTAASWDKDKKSEMKPASDKEAYEMAEPVKSEAMINQNTDVEMATKDKADNWSKSDKKDKKRMAKSDKKDKMHKEAWKQNRFEAAFEAMDKNNDDMISKSEFAEWQGRSVNYIPQFEDYDTDSDGDIAMNEYMSAAKS